MPFDYVASTKEGQVIHGVSNLRTREAVLEELQAKGLVAVSIEERGGEVGSSRLRRWNFGWVSHVDKMLFTKHLSVMLKAGLTLSDALTALVDQPKSSRMRAVLASVLEQIERGESFSDALARHSKIFSHFFVHIVRAGEVSGNLETNLGHLAEQFSRDFNLRKKVKSALLYPTLVFSAALLIGFFFASFVLPQVASVFVGLRGIELPLVTRALLAISGFVRNHTLVSFLLIVATVAFFFWFIRRKFLAPLTHYLTIHLPVVGMISREVNLARFSLVLGTLLRSGIDIVQALEIIREVLDNIYYKRAISEAHIDVQRGIALGDSLKRHQDLFPAVVTHMVDVGESSGSLEQVLQYLAEFYDLEVDSTMKNLSSILEPVLLLFIGLVALMLAYSILIPVYNYISAIRGI